MKGGNSYVKYKKECVCFPHGATSVVIQSAKIGILLANTYQGCWKHCENPRGLPNLCITLNKPLSIYTAHSTNMALANMGDGLGTSLTNGLERKQIRCCCNSILHKMDRSKTTSNNHFWNNQEVLLVEYRVQIWSSKLVDSGQWKIVWFKKFQIILSEHRNQDCLRLSLSPRIKRSGGKSKEDNILYNFQNTVQSPQRKMDSRAAMSCVVSQNNRLKSHRSTPFKLLYGEEAMLLEEVKHQSLRTMWQLLAEDEGYCKETV